MTSRPRSDLDQIVGNVADACLATDLEGVVVTLNFAAAELLGIDPATAPGQRCWALLGGVARDGRPVCAEECPALQTAQRGGFSLPVEMMIPRRDSTARPGDGWTARLVQHVRVAGEATPAAVLHIFADIGETAPRPRLGRRRPVGPNAWRVVGQHPDVSVLTRRERQVLHLLAAGLTTRQVAEQLDVHFTTARNHAQHILEKLGAPNRVAALALALEGDGPDGGHQWLSQPLGGAADRAARAPSAPEHDGPASGEAPAGGAATWRVMTRPPPR